MDNDEPEGWTSSEYKTFKVDGSESTDSDSDSDSESDTETTRRKKMKGYFKKDYKKILVTEELLPE